MGKNNSRKPPAAIGHHYLYSWVARKALPSAWSFKKIRQELGRLREELIERYGGDKVLPEAVILIDSVVESLGVQKLMGLYIRKAGIMREDSLKAGNLELHSALGKNWIAYGNVVRQNLMALKELGGPHEAGPLDLGRYIAENYPEKPAGSVADVGGPEKLQPGGNGEAGKGEDSQE